MSNTKLCSPNDFLHWKVVVLLEKRYCSSEDRVWWVSILIDNGIYALDQKSSCLTLLLCSTSARCCAPPSPILFTLRLRMVSAYIERYWCICSRSEDKLSYHIVLQCLCQMLCSFSTNFVVVKIEHGDCLYWSIMVYMQSIRNQVILPYCSTVLEPDVVPL
jgi:hypothetical protein